MRGAVMEFLRRVHGVTIRNKVRSCKISFSMIDLDVLLLLHCWLNLVYFHRYVDLSLSHILRFSVLKNYALDFSIF